MTPDAVFARLEQILVEERAAIRCRDSETVVRLADEKERCLAVLKELGPEGLAPHRGKLTSLSAGLRHNGVLLAHARDCVRDALGALGIGTKGTNRDKPPPGRLVSARG